MHHFFSRIRLDERGAALVEYGLLVGLIAVICAVAITLLGQELSDGFSAVASGLSGV